MKNPPPAFGSVNLAKSRKSFLAFFGRKARAEEQITDETWPRIITYPLVGLVAGLIAACLYGFFSGKIGQ